MPKIRYFIAAKTLEISNEANFDPDKTWQKGSYALRKLYHETEKPLFVVYTSSSCGPCHILKPQLHRVLNESKGKAIGVEIDIENDQDIAKQAEVSGTPTVHLFKNKELINKPRSREEAYNILKLLNGKKHYLISSVCISKNGSMIWNYTDKAEDHSWAHNVKEKSFFHYLKYICGTTIFDI